ncbi:MAG: FAD-dependent oxidoreductase, partial [Deltaproteobacteria bacterium]|nr:FAD-dependent oxidoreductase [Deltaproteobacteria bacterium]
MNAPQSPSLVILGGGVAGVAVAYYAQRLGVPCTLFEKNAWIGGLSRTFQAGEHFYDSGAHRFHDQYADTTADVRSLLGDELRQVRSPSKIYDRGNLIDFPPTPLNLLGSLSVREIGKACFDLVRARCTIQNPKSFEEFAIGRFGESLARRYLIRYTEKLWGLPADELSVDVATRRLSGMSFGTLVKEILAPSRKADHIDGEFLYPHRGIGRIVDAMAATLPPGSIRKEHEVAKIVCRKGRVNRILFTNGAEVAPGSRVISTLPVGRLASLLGDAISPES